MSLSTVFPLILTVLTVIGVVLSPALQGAGALTVPPKRVRRSLIKSWHQHVLKQLVHLFGKPISTPPADVVRAFHRGHDLVVLSHDGRSGRLAWSA